LSDIIALIIKKDLTVEVEDEEHLDDINTEPLKIGEEWPAYDWNALH
jgi:hypothetical protein